MNALFLGLAMCVSYLLVGFNIRACAQARYGWTAVTDAAIALFGFYIIRWVVSATTTIEVVGYVVGGVIGGALGIFISKRVFGEGEK